MSTLAQFFHHKTFKPYRAQVIKMLHKTLRHERLMAQRRHDDASDSIIRRRAYAHLVKDFQTVLDELNELLEGVYGAANPRLDE